MTEDEMETDGSPVEAITIPNSQTLDELPDEMDIDPPNDQTVRTDRISEEGRTTEGSFHSARENMTTRDISKDTQPITGAPETLPGSFPAEVEQAIEVLPDAPVPEDGDDLALEDNGNGEDVSQTSDGSSPVKIIRKSSLNFASLPAREPLTTKKSIGNRVSRTSNLDTAKNTALNRGSYLGRYTGGKSIGAAQPMSDDEMDIDEDPRPTLVREESDGDGKITRLHNKSSTQRLHERINLLGKTQLARATKSITTAVGTIQPSYPDLSKSRAEERLSRHHEKEPPLKAQEPVQPTKSAEKSPTRVPPSPARAPSPVFSLSDEDDDWIRPPVKRSEPVARPPLAKSRTVDVMEQISGKDSIAGNESGRDMDFEDYQPHSPAQPVESSTPRVILKSISTTALASPSKPMELSDSGRVKANSVSNPTMPFMPSTTPAGSPSKFPMDGHHLSASKSKLHSIMKSARGLFTSSAGVSAQAKMETMSPSAKLRNKISTTTLQNVIGHTGGQSMYPSLPNDSRVQLLPESPPKGPRTRSSIEREEKRREKEAKEAKDRQKADMELEKAREKERAKALRYKDNMKPLPPKPSELTAPSQSSLEQTSRPVRQSPRRMQKQNENPVQAAPEQKPASVMGPPPPRTQAQNSQKAKDARRPLPVPKPRPQPVSIRVGTLSQQSQRFPVSNAPMSTGLGDSLSSSQSKVPTLEKKTSTASLQSTTSFKSSASTKLKSLAAAEKKKEQEQREAQRKREQKLEVERRRLAAQEEAQKREIQQRQEAERQREMARSVSKEDPKRIAQKEAIEKRRLELSKKEQHREPQRVVNDLARSLHAEQQAFAGPSHRPELGGPKPPSRLQDFPRPPAHHHVPNPAKTKRVFDPDQDDELCRPMRTQPGQNYQPNETKRRRTGDEDLFDPPTRPTMAPPIRQSNIRKEAPKSSVFGNNYPTAPPPASFHANNQNHMKSAMATPYQQHGFGAQASRPAHPMDMAKFTNGKIPFADAPNPSQSAYKTPLPAKHAMQPPPTKSSPLYPNGENIYLDDILTDSEEEDSEDEREKKANQPDWARTPNLFAALAEQESKDPDQVFGPIAPLVMEEIFKDKKRHHRFRSRTSSANWFGGDRLTEEDIKNDKVARERLTKAGGWTYQDMI